MSKVSKKSEDGVRKSVSEFYARSVVSKGPSCCGGSLPKGVAAKTAGYKSAELAALPEDAVENSFGCGNPLAFAGVKKGETVLDLGSGAGIDLLIAAEKVGPGGKVIGVDMTDEMLKKARANIKKAGLKNVEVRKGIIENLPVEAASVDWVISNCVINLSPEKHRVFAEIFRVLKPGGRISVSDIVAEDLPAWIRSNAALYSSCIAGAISEKDYLAGLKAAGMTDVKVADRFVYEAAQMTGIVESEMPSCGCGCTPDKDTIEKIAGALDGKVWSAKITARKPARKSA